MKFDVVIADIGSTFTKVSCFDKLGDETPVFVGKAKAPTSIQEGDVSTGLIEALNNLKKQLSISDISWNDFLVSCSAAGGLVMTVHGLVKDMTVKAAQEAALGAGGVLHFSTAGIISEYDIKEIYKINPKIILLTGGVDYGESDIIIKNAEILSQLQLDIPVIYAGNSSIKNIVKDIFQSKGKLIIITDNVYPSIDTLNILPVKKEIYKTFEKEIIKAPGMERINDFTKHPIIPTPVAVMRMAELAHELFPDILVVDLGGATTDIHSVTDGSEAIIDKMISPEPKSKRTVEGDLGVFINKNNIYKLFSEDEKNKLFEKIGDIQNINKYPSNQPELNAITQLSIKAIREAIKRHVGTVGYQFALGGKREYCEGKDLTAIKTIIGTGGVLSNVSIDISAIINELQQSNKKLLLPNSKNINYYEDKNYIMASLGTLSAIHPKASQKLFKEYIYN